MDSFWVIVLFILFAIFSDRKDKKKPVPKRRIPDFPQRPLPDIPQPKQERIKIEIPELRGAPPLPDIQTTAEVETQDAIRAQQERYQEMLRRKKKQREQAEKRAESQRVEQAQAPQNTVTLSNLQQAVIWSEILGKPKAKR
ncbi:hypothetical protein [Selenomonas ruminantium]|uniref:Uncharacterized protein n=1 Tax=Selenomonas ruminantium TaxID=971 RepID=A0A1K1QVZ3_SELRU|nr:hypothetical protein [Selenomonas ruminantium]SFW63787.1 hypothetical protein SAMN02910323_0171 [Selenomonas ruminantium]